MKYIEARKLMKKGELVVADGLLYRLKKNELQFYNPRCFKFVKNINSKETLHQSEWVLA